MGALRVPACHLLGPGPAELPAWPGLFSSRAAPPPPVAETTGGCQGCPVLGPCGESRAGLAHGGAPVGHAHPVYRSTRACSCGVCPWWAGTTVTRTARRCPHCRTSTHRWTTSCGCREPAMAFSPASPCSAVRSGPGRQRGVPGGGSWPRSQPALAICPQHPTTPVTRAPSPRLHLSGSCHPPR